MLVALCAPWKSGPYFFIASKLIISVKPLCKNARHCASCLRSISSSSSSGVGLFSTVARISCNSRLYSFTRGEFIFPFSACFGYSSWASDHAEFILPLTLSGTSLFLFHFAADTFTTPFRVCLVRLASRISSDAPFYVVLPLRLRGHIVFGIYGGGIFCLLFELSRSSLGFYAPGLLRAPLSLVYFILCPFTFRPCAARSPRLPLARYIGSDPISSGGVPFSRRDRKRYYREVSPCFYYSAFTAFGPLLRPLVRLLQR